MNDPNFSQYHGKFKKPSEEDIVSSLYECSSYYVQKRDTSDIDSLAMMDDEILLDEEGNPIIHEETEGNTTDPSSPEKKTEKVKEQAVTFDDL